jgi:hypothetical protein
MVAQCTHPHNLLISLGLLNFCWFRIPLDGFLDVHALTAADDAHTWRASRGGTAAGTPPSGAHACGKGSSVVASVTYADTAAARKAPLLRSSTVLAEWTAADRCMSSPSTTSCQLEYSEACLRRTSLSFLLRRL